MYLFLCLLVYPLLCFRPILQYINSVPLSWNVAESYYKDSNLRSRAVEKKFRMITKSTFAPLPSCYECDPFEGRGGGDDIATLHRSQLPYSFLMKVVTISESIHNPLCEIFNTEVN